jgi:ElaA protein
MESNVHSVSWSLLTFDELSKKALMSILTLRQQVFMLEQNSLYPDIDGVDEVCAHLLLLHNDLLIGYARLAPPGTCNKSYPVLGRIVLAVEARGKGLGDKLIERGLDALGRWYPGMPIKISAQVPLIGFYQKFDFRVISEPYDDGGVMHVDMLRGK